MNEANKNNNNKTDHTNPIIEENRILSIRLTLAQAFVSMWRRAYDALLHHGINFRKLPEYQDPERLLDRAETVPIEEGRVLMLEYIERVESDIHAAIRRKGMRLV